MPALALGQALANIGRETAVDYFCGNRDVELRIYRRAGVAPRVLPVGSQMAGSSARRFWQKVKLGASFLRCFFLMGRYDVAVGMGGYVAAPVLFAAWLRRKPIILHDSNTILGKVSRAMASRAKIVACGMPLAVVPEKIDRKKLVEIGTPVRLNINKGNREAAAKSMYLRPDAFTLFIYGGSLGARGLNQLMAEALGKIGESWPHDKAFQVVWATGGENIEAVKAALRDKTIRGQLWLAPEIDDMDQAYAISDLVVARAGGSFLAELMLCGKPSILFPLPNSSENHQLHNAEVLAKRQAALLLDEKSVSPDELAGRILDLALNPAKRETMARACAKLACPDAARDLAKLIVDSAKRQK
jgi:UDP-N-acetylglucosamine--N-acetylmuramyl-(pentapeptide) pyrophosphoryl-undecaprenol N-acetylglucosamine transferase